jgi:hypothetical protein
MDRSYEADTIKREQTLLERLQEAEHAISRLTRIAERTRDRLDTVLGSEPEPPEVLRGR